MLHEEAERAREYLSIGAEEMSVHLEVQGQSQVQAEPELVQRALTTLMSNAIRHAQADSVVRMVITRKPTEPGCTSRTGARRLLRNTWNASSIASTVSTLHVRPSVAVPAWALPSCARSWKRIGAMSSRKATLRRT